MPDLSTTFAALGDPFRFTLVDRLMREGELSAGDLSKTASISPPAVSRHLKVLREAGVIEQRINKQRRMYSVRPQAVRTITSWADSHHEFWLSSLDRLEQALNDETPIQKEQTDE